MPMSMSLSLSTSMRRLSLSRFPHDVARSSSQRLRLRLRRQQERFLTSHSHSHSGKRTESHTKANVKTKATSILVASAAALGVGFAMGRYSVPVPNSQEEKEKEKHLHLPNGMPRTCCEESPQQKKNEEDQAKYDKLGQELRRIVGRNNVINGLHNDGTPVTTPETSHFLKGARIGNGNGNALFIVKPQKLKEVVETVQAVVDANCVVLVQGSNTGLTGGSVPRPQADGRPTVVISMKAFDTVFPIDKGNKVVCLAGVGLASLADFVEQTFPQRESHSILGSTFLNPTTAAGVSFGSGGTQMRKGPAYTERALYLKVLHDKFGKPVVKLVNTLGIQDLDVEEGEIDAHIRHNGIIRTLDRYIDTIKGGMANNTTINTTMKKSNTTHGHKDASDSAYRMRLCQNDAHVNRFNADTSGCDCNRSEGKVLILASVHDTFPKPQKQKTFWISFDTFDKALKFRREVCLHNPDDVPVSMEYLDRDSFDVIDSSGRLLGNTIKAVGTSSSVVRHLWNAKLRIEALNIRGASTIGDKILYWINPILPSILPNTIMKMGKEKDHHIAMTVGDFDGSLQRFLSRMDKFQLEHKEHMAVHECDSGSEEMALTAFRFVAAPAFRTYCVGNQFHGFSVDYALPRNGGQAPSLTSDRPLKRMRYSHFGCNVVHEDVAFSADTDVESIKYALKKSVESECKGKLPAEHGHGCEYQAPQDTKKRWMKMDPLNVMNPGIGGLSTSYRYETKANSTHID